MSKNITIIDKDYAQWVEDLSERYRRSQVRAAVKVNREMIQYYWELGRDIEEMHVEERWGQSVIKNLSIDLQSKNANTSGLSRTNIYYAKKFYLLYSSYLEIVPQAVGQLGGASSQSKGDAESNVPQPVGQVDAAIVPQAVAQLEKMLFAVPWGHHRYIMDKLRGY